MDTYGDMVTLLLTFFVLLFSFSNVDAEKWKALVDAFTGSPVEVTSTLDTAQESEVSVVNDAGTKQRVEERTKEQFKELYEKIKKHIEENGLSTKLSVEMKDGEILMRLSDSILFASGSARLVESAVPLMHHIGGLLKEAQDSIGIVRIEGHTDNRPISNSLYADNWQLSSARAYTVLCFLKDNEMVNQDKLSYTAYGEQHPIASNKTEEGKAKNRRVDFVIVRK
ncbi:MAG: flagellar motor protein MotB [Clostridiales bacterium]|nr:flagellar motor protein MotB [Clostridiales bacterium]